MIKQSFKTKVAIMVSYIGTNYHGLQYQAENPTIESALYQAIINAVGISRGARTDKGVHALCNCVAFKLQINPHYCPHMTGNKFIDKRNVDWNLVKENINQQLPYDIRINGIKNVTQTFNVRKQAESRIYSYIMPQILQSDSQLQEICNQYLGTHNFHNYSIQQSFFNSSSMRYIKEFDVNSFEFQGYKFHKFKIHANSFMYHQIRKMIGTVYQVVKENKHINFISDSFKENKLQLYIAPQIGLYLREVLFTGYNLKTDIPEKIEIEQEQREEIQRFEDQLVKIICNQYIQENVLEEWYKQIQFYQEQ